MTCDDDLEQYFSGESSRATTKRPAPCSGSITLARVLSRFGRYVARHHVGLLALMVALGGTSYAAIRLPAGSVGTKQLRGNSVTSAKVKDRSLLARDFRSGQLPTGPTGPAGAPGAKGDAGARGEAGAAGAAIVQTARSTGPVTLAASAQPVPLTGNTWTQRAGEINVLYGQVRLTLPATTAACSADPANRYLYVGLAWNGQSIGQYSVYLYPLVGEYSFKILGIGLGSQPGEYASFVQPFLAPPSSDTPGTLEMIARDLCNGSAHYQVESAELQVVRIAP